MLVCENMSPSNLEALSHLTLIENKSGGISYTLIHVLDLRLKYQTFTVYNSCVICDTLIHCIDLRLKNQTFTVHV